MELDNTNFWLDIEIIQQLLLTNIGIASFMRYRHQTHIVYI